jgi:Ni/Fe-hydrogenase b-type cytochrome subunit
VSAGGVVGRATAGGRADGSGGAYRWVYLWHWPIRAMHWLAAGSIVVLIATGFYIGRPYFMTGGEASEHFLMGRVRFAHFAAAAVLVGTAVVRVYWLFAGNRYERWPALFPVTRRSLRGLLEMGRYYLLLPGARHPHYLGHNPLQQLAYTALYATAALAVVTGFALYAQADPGGWWWRLTAWWLPWFPGGLRGVRLVHHASTWVFLVFIPLHVYLALRADVLDREGTASSILSGGRWVPAGQRFDDE